MSILRLQVSFDIDRKEIQIDFPTPHHAEYYHRQINKNGQNYLDNDKVNFILPQSVQKMEASATYEGFIFHFAVDIEAARWADVIWRHVPGTSRQLYIKRTWDLNELNQALQVFERGDPVVVEVPARAERSQGIKLVKALFKPM